MLWIVVTRHWWRRESDGLKGEHGRECYVDIGGGEHAVLGSRFHSPLCIASSLCAPVHPQQWLFRFGLAWLWVIYSSAALWGHCGAQLLHISTGGQCAAVQQIHSLTWAQAQPPSAWVTARKGESTGAPTLYTPAGEPTHTHTQPPNRILKTENRRTHTDFFINTSILFELDEDYTDLWRSLK